MASKIKGIEQGRARAAYDFVNEVVNADKNLEEFKKKYDVKGEPREFKKKYESGAKKLPVLIKTNGLGQSLAFIKNRDEGWKIIYQQLTGWLQKRDLIQEVIEMESNDYRRITVECISFLNWLRRFVDGLMEDVEEDNP